MLVRILPKKKKVSVGNFILVIW